MLDCNRLPPQLLSANQSQLNGSAFIDTMKFRKHGLGEQETYYANSATSRYMKQKNASSSQEQDISSHLRMLVRLFI